MSDIDPRTVLLLTGIMGGLMSLVLYALKRSKYPPAKPGALEVSRSKRQTESLTRFLDFCIGGYMVTILTSHEVVTLEPQYFHTSSCYEHLTTNSSQ